MRRVPQLQPGTTILSSLVRRVVHLTDNYDVTVLWLRTVTSYLSHVTAVFEWSWDLQKQVVLNLPTELCNPPTSHTITGLHETTRNLVGCTLQHQEDSLDTDYYQQGICRSVRSVGSRQLNTRLQQTCSVLATFYSRICSI
jgi:hypothetical protein